jgi:hypothetical protein
MNDVTKAPEQYMLNISVACRDEGRSKPVMNDLKWAGPYFI